MHADRERRPGRRVGRRRRNRLGHGLGTLRRVRSRAYREPMLAAASITDGERVLDVGCGNGQSVSRRRPGHPEPVRSSASTCRPRCSTRPDAKPRSKASATSTSSRPTPRSTRSSRARSTSPSAASARCSSPTSPPRSPTSPGRCARAAACCWSCGSRCRENEQFATMFATLVRGPGPADTPARRTEPVRPRRPRPRPDLAHRSRLHRHRPSSPSRAVRASAPTATTPSRSRAEHRSRTGCSAGSTIDSPRHGPRGAPGRDAGPRDPRRGAVRLRHLVHHRPATLTRTAPQSPTRSPTPKENPMPEFVQIMRFRTGESVIRVAGRERQQ